MGTITLNYPDAQQSRIAAALCRGENVTLANAKKAIIELVRREVMTYESSQAEIAATITVEQAQKDRQTAVDAARISAEAVTIS